MSKPEKLLLSTRPLPKAVIDEAAGKGITVEELSFITTQPVLEQDLVERIKQAAAEERTVVFTSMNAVEAVAAQVQDVKSWKIYSIGNTTRQLIEEKFGSEKLVATAENALRLGERLVDDGVTDVLFFCGNIRRNELPNKVRSEGGKVEEIVVYETEETPVKLSKLYDGILFFSPSAVEAFFKQNAVTKSTILFAIGKTTEEALRQHKAKNIVVGQKTGKAELAQLAIHVLSGHDAKTFVS